MVGAAKGDSPSSLLPLSSLHTPTCDPSLSLAPLSRLDFWKSLTAVHSRYTVSTDSLEKSGEGGISRGAQLYLIIDTVGSASIHDLVILEMNRGVTTLFGLTG